MYRVRKRGLVDGKAKLFSPEPRLMPCVEEAPGTVAFFARENPGIKIPIGRLVRHPKAPACLEYVRSIFQGSETQVNVIIAREENVGAVRYRAFKRLADDRIGIDKQKSIVLDVVIHAGFQPAGTLLVREGRVVDGNDPYRRPGEAVDRPFSRQ